MSSGRIGRVGAGLFDAEQRWSDAQKFLPDAEYVKKGAELSSLTGVAMTHLGNGDIFYGVDTTAGSVTVTLPDVADTVGQTHIVKRLTGGTNACDVVSDNGPFDSGLSQSIAVANGVRVYFSDGIRWRNVGAVGSAGSGEIQAGVYTPTLTGVTNVDTVSATSAQYMSVNGVTTVGGQIFVKPTASGVTSEVGISLPVPSNFTAGVNNEAGGTATSGAPEIGRIFSDGTNDRAALRFTAASSATTSFFFQFTYRVNP